MNPAIELQEEKKEADILFQMAEECIQKSTEEGPVIYHEGHWIQGIHSDQRCRCS